MKDYELALILHPDLEIDLDSTLAKIEKQITAADGKVGERDNWGKRKLAYPIAKQNFGIYVFYQLQLPPQQVNTLEKSLLITSEVIRHLLVRKYEPNAKMLAKIKAREAKAKKPAAKKAAKEE